jgi:tetratricopeptide (TPR) repeat protein
VPAVPWLQARIDSALGEFRPQEEVLYLWSGKRVKAVVPGWEGIAADIYWLRTVQYFGGRRAFSTDKSFALLYPLIDITTTLDPRLEIAYRYGAIFLSEPAPSGAGRPQEGIAILERGARELPDSWRLRQDLGFFYYLFLKDAEKASEVLTEASKIPGAAFWLKAMAADLLAKGGDREKSRRMWWQMYEQAEEGILKSNALGRLQVLDALDQADRLTEALGKFERRHGRRPASLPELRASGLARDPIVDSTGVPFELDPETGRVTVSHRSVLWRAEG